MVTLCGRRRGWPLTSIFEFTAGGGACAAAAWAGFWKWLGFNVKVLEGGYKAYRRWVKQVLAEPKPLIVLGGMTGTSKTQILHELANLGEPVLDLEAPGETTGAAALAALMLPPQPSTEHYENLLAEKMGSAGDRPPHLGPRPESRRVGTCRIPDELFFADGEGTDAGGVAIAGRTPRPAGRHLW